MPYGGALHEAISVDGSLSARLPSQEIGKRPRLVMSLQLRGFRQKEIATLLGLSENRVSVICTSRRYLAEFDRQLTETDQEFLRLKPLAFRALQNGLTSTEEAIGLRAADLWFKAMGYRGFGAVERDGQKLSAEDIAMKLLELGGGSITISAQSTSSRSVSQPEAVIASQGQESSP